MADGQAVTSEELYALVVHVSMRNPELIMRAWKEGRRRAAAVRAASVPEKGN